MNEQSQIELVKQGYDHFKNGDIESLLNLMSDDIQWESPKVDNVPFSGKHQGKQMVREFFQQLASEQDAIEFMPMEFIAQGDKVVCLGRDEWKTKDGHGFGGDWAHVFTVRDGKVVAVHEYLDTAAAAAAYSRG